MIRDLKNFHIDSIKPRTLLGLNWFGLVSILVSFSRVIYFTGSTLEPFYLNTVLKLPLPDGQ